MKSQKLCSVIIVTYNSRSFIPNCLRSIVGLWDFEVKVVDNNSQDSSATMVEREFSSIKVMALNENLGFGRA